MKLKMNFFVALSISALLILFVAGLAQDKDQTTNTEIKAEVPALTEFHTVIYKLWHTAWPNKDYTMMSQLLPEIEKYSSDIAKAELPGILRDKRTTWDANVKTLMDIVKEYKTAVDSKNNEDLLQSAENLHRQYEKLVRTIRPVMKELAAFHEVLYPLYHYYMPNNDLDKIKTSATELKSKMDELNQASLPERWKEKEKKFISARKKLSKSVNELLLTVKSDNEKKIKSAIEKMHTNYQALEKIFD
jgi:hypothetical protein